MDTTKISNAASNMRRNIIELGYHAGNKGAHFGPSLSIVEIMAVLYLNQMNIRPEEPDWPMRDRFILSKGHGGLGYYTALFESGIITKEQLYTFEENGGKLPGQPSFNKKMGIDSSSGSLGLGLSFGAGVALAAQKKKMDFRTYVLMGDGEINEGSVWEAAMFAGSHKISNLIAIVDKNGMQSDGCTDEILAINIAEIWQAMGWAVKECDGHDIESLIDAFNSIDYSRPTVIIAKTVKGKGISYMENNREWHHNHLTEKDYHQAVSELEGMEKND